ncbi:MAG: dienelactone hydrolase family protein [Planctomycetota bacterium]
MPGPPAPMPHSPFPEDPDDHTTPHITPAMDIRTETIDYDHDGTTLEGYLAYDASSDVVRPGIVIVHAWMGLDDNARDRARQLAQLGYVAFCADIYGKGVRPATREEASAQAGKYRADRALLRGRANAAVTWLRSHALCDNDRIAAIGYCFGGGTVLELARSGCDIRGVVSFHGNLDTPNPADAKQIKAAVLVCHGAEDKGVTQERVTDFIAEMRAAGDGVDWQLVQYGSAVHGFTHVDTPAYNEKAERRSWELMLDFFEDVLR